MAPTSRLAKAAQKPGMDRKTVVRPPALTATSEETPLPLFTKNKRLRSPPTGRRLEYLGRRSFCTGTKAHRCGSSVARNTLETANRAAIELTQDGDYPSRKFREWGRLGGRGDDGHGARCRNQHHHNELRRDHKPPVYAKCRKHSPWSLAEEIISVLCRAPFVSIVTRAMKKKWRVNMAFGQRLLEQFHTSVCHLGVAEVQLGEPACALSFSSPASVILVP